MTPNADPRRSISRLAVAIATADGRVTSNELVALRELDLLGLGRLSAIVEEELLAAVERPIDVRQTCEGLVRLGPQAAAIVLTVLAHVAASDGVLSPRESETFRTIAACLGIPVAEAGFVLEAAIAATHAHRVGRETAAAASAVPSEDSKPVGRSAGWPATRVLGVERGASRERLEAAYLAAIERYDPMKMISLGADFVRLSVRKLAEITDAFDEARAAGEPSGPPIAARAET